MIFCNHILEHVDDDRQAMRELFRVMRPGGWGSCWSPVNPDRRDDLRRSVDHRPRTAGASFRSERSPARLRQGLRRALGRSRVRCRRDRLHPFPQSGSGGVVRAAFGNDLPRSEGIRLVRENERLSAGMYVSGREAFLYRAASCVNRSVLRRISGCRCRPTVFRSAAATS